MSTIMRKTLLAAALTLGFAAVPAWAQDAMQGMDMPMHQHAEKSQAEVNQSAKDAKHAKHAKKEESSKPSFPRMRESSASASKGSKSLDSRFRGNDEQEATGHSMHNMDMHGMQNMQGMKGMKGMKRMPMQMASHDSIMRPPPQTTGELERLHIGNQIGVRPVVRGLNLGTMKMDMRGMQMQGGSPPPDARSPDYSDGVGYGPTVGMGMAMSDSKPLGMLLIDQLEYFDARDENGVALNAQAWYGTDANKLWLKTEGEHSDGRLQELRAEVLWDRPIAIYWDTQIGVRHDFGAGPDRTWAAFGIQGLAPYWFDIEATAYVGQAGRTALRFEAEYEELITQRLILQPSFEINFYGRDDPERGVGAGLSDAELGLRLRYEFSRQFAPYIGVVLTRKFGKTADFSRDAGESVFDPRIVAGVRFWF